MYRLEIMLSSDGLMGPLELIWHSAKSGDHIQGFEKRG